MQDARKAHRAAYLRSNCVAWIRPDRPTGPAGNEHLAPRFVRRGRERMLSAILGRKVGMTQIFGDKGAAIPVTVIEAGPCFVTQVKTASSDGYEAVQLGFGTAKTKNTTRPILGHLGHTLQQTPAQKRRT